MYFDFAASATAAVTTHTQMRFFCGSVFFLLGVYNCLIYCHYKLPPRLSIKGFNDQRHELPERCGPWMALHWHMLLLLIKFEVCFVNVIYIHFVRVSRRPLCHTRIASNIASLLRANICWGAEDGQLLPPSPPRCLAHTVPIWFLGNIYTV
jgi:hypothetical protein